MTLPSASASCAATFAGIDVGAHELVLVVRDDHNMLSCETFANTPTARSKLLKTLQRLLGCTICLEATGVYSMDLTIAMHDAALRVMLLNPHASHHFAKVLGKHSKTDAVDADTLAQYAQRMPFVPWTRPSPTHLALRQYARRIQALTYKKTVSKNQTHAIGFLQDTPKAIERDLRLEIKQLDKRIEALSQHAYDLIQSEPALKQAFELMLGVKGIGQASAIALLGELLLLPQGLNHRQWVKSAGLDPKQFRSGTSVDKPSRISKAGNAHIRAALYMPALSAKTHEPHVKAFFEHLIAMGKTPLQALCAVMRKLLHALHGMLSHRQPFDPSRFYRPQTIASS